MAAFLKVNVFATLLVVGSGFFFGWALSRTNYRHRQTVKDLGEANQQLTDTGAQTAEGKNESERSAKNSQTTMTALEGEQYSLGDATYHGW